MRSKIKNERDIYLLQFHELFTDLYSVTKFDYLLDAKRQDKAFQFKPNS